MKLFGVPYQDLAGEKVQELAEALRLADEVADHLGDILNGMDLAWEDDEFERACSKMLRYKAVLAKYPPTSGNGEVNPK